jgi:MFS family permease
MKNKPVDTVTSIQDKKIILRKTLRYSQQEAVASATMTGTSDNFLNAFAIYLQATAMQLGWLTAIPQLFGAVSQIMSVWLGNHVRRKPLVVVAAFTQSLIVAGMATLALVYGLGRVQESPMSWLIVLAVGYFTCLNCIQPHWRAWMGSLVPQMRRGVFFAARTRLTMAASLLVYVSGGTALSITALSNNTWRGFFLLFAVAASGRLISSVLLGRMHDPEPESAHNAMRLQDSWRHVRDSLKDPTFRNYSFFVACMQGAVALSAPFFAMYMLRDLEFTYLQYSLNSIASIGTQLVMLKYWGKFSDRFGNHLVMVISSCIIPLIPLLWLVSPDYIYLLFVQVVSGIFWSGFTLSTANYLYDIRPHHTNFALYAAIQSGTGALMVFCGGLSGGYLARHAPEIALSFNDYWRPGSDLFIVFITTALLRTVVVGYFVPLLKEPSIRRRPKILELIFRVARFNAISGVALDWVSVARKKHPAADENSELPKNEDDEIN